MPIPTLSQNLTSLTPCDDQEEANDAVHQLRVASTHASQPMDKCRVALLLAEALNEAGVDRVTDAKVKLAE